MINVLFNDTLNAILNPPFKAEFNTNVKASLKEKFVFWIANGPKYKQFCL